MFSLSLFAQEGIAIPGMIHCDNAITSFLQTYDIPGATLALARNGKLVYARSFGNADLAGNEPVYPHTLFRIASVSKPITSIAIMKMVENGDISLGDKVFGANGILENHPYLGQVNYTDNRLNDITVQHLLEHTGGWDRNTDCVPNPTSPYPFDFNSCDPIGFPLHVTQTLGESNPVTEEMHIRFLMEKGLDFTPGTQFAYSNIGYLVLGEIIEEVSGMSYEEFVKSAILAPIGICDMHIGKNLLADKMEREAEYEGNGYTISSLYGTGQNVPWEYGGWNLEAMDAHGGWIATARDLVRLLLAVDGFTSKPDILNTNTINTMISPSAQFGNYAKGWLVNNAGNWWHDGSLDGTASYWVRTSGQGVWAIILNKRIIDANANQFLIDLDGLPWACFQNTTNWPTHDLLDTPTEAPSNIDANVSSIGLAELSWTSGNGSNRIVVAKAGMPVDAFPLDGSTYSGVNIFGMGSEIGNGNFVAYEGTGSSVTLTGLDSSETYYVRVFEYNKSANTGGEELYSLCHSVEISFQAGMITSIPDLQAAGISFFPNPGQQYVSIRQEQVGSADKLVIRDMQGRIVREESISSLRTQIDLGHLSAQVYMFQFEKDGEMVGMGKWLKR
ncbi:MAG: serine hydrolase [Bacteroidota bacterium]